MLLWHHHAIGWETVWSSARPPADYGPRKPSHNGAGREESLAFQTRLARGTLTMRTANHAMHENGKSRVSLCERGVLVDIRDKVVIISGASSGIGRALAEVLAARGSKVVMLARRTEKLIAIETALKAAHHEVLAIPTDVTNRDQVSQAVRATLDTFGRVDVVVNNAGIGYFGTIENVPMDEFNRLIQTNVYGMLNLSQCALPALKETHGLIVNVSSMLSKRALPFLAAYSSTKSMMNALADGLRLEVRPYGVRVLTYCAPETETEFHAVTTHEVGLQTDPGGRRKKASAKEVAERIVQAIVEGKREVVAGKSLEILSFLAPKVVDNIFYKSMVQKILKS